MSFASRMAASVLCIVLLLVTASAARTGAQMSHEHRRRMSSHPEGGKHRVKALMAVLVS